MRNDIVVTLRRVVMVAMFTLSAVSAMGQVSDAEGMRRDSAVVVQLILGYSSVNRELGDTLSKYGDMSREDVFVPLGKRVEAAKEAMNEGLWQFVHRYSDTPQAADMLKLLIGLNGGEIDVERADTVLAGFQRLRDHRYVAYMRSLVNGERLRAQGAAVAELTLSRPDGTMMNLTDVVGRGNYVLVDFWASWCGPCCAEMPNVKAAYEKYHAKGFDVVGVSLDDRREAWVGAIEKYELPWHHISDLKGWDGLCRQVYGVRAIPLTILYGPDGRVVASKLRGAELLEVLGKIYD